MPKWPAGLTPKVANIILGSPIALEMMPPIEGLLAGIVCLSATLVGPKIKYRVFFQKLNIFTSLFS